MTATLTATLDAVRMMTPYDESPDTSWLEDQPEWADRLAAYRRDEFAFVGVYAEATLTVGGQRMVVTSPGLWGIEDDSGPEYLAEVYREELGELAHLLAPFGITLDDLTAAA